MIEIKNKTKTISAFFYFNEPESIGNMVIINTLSFIASHFNVYIYTNQAEFLRRQLPDVRIISLNHIKLLRNSIFGMLYYCRKIAKILDSDKSDAVFIGHNSAPITLWLTKTCFQYVYQTHEMLGLERKSGFSKIYQIIMEYIIIKGIRASKTNFVVSEPIIQYLRLHNSHNLYLTPHCVDLKRFSRPGFSDIHNGIIRKKEQGYFIVCYTGWISEVRGLHLMLESLYFSLLKDPKILFVIAGSDVQHTGEINKYFLERNLEGNVICLGKIEYDFIPGVIALSDVCLSILEDNPVYQMSPPQKVIEYMASGKPVIANNIQTHTMLITDEYDGFLTENDPAIISDRILFLKANPEIYELMSKNVLKTASKFDTSLVYKEMEEVINHVLNNSQDSIDSHSINKKNINKVTNKASHLAKPVLLTMPVRSDKI
jgi:glycosyltransferase involved in cell wall biosynthesis